METNNEINVISTKVLKHYTISYSNDNENSIILSDEHYLIKNSSLLQSILEINSLINEEDEINNEKNDENDIILPCKPFIHLISNDIYDMFKIHETITNLDEKDKLSYINEVFNDIYNGLSYIGYINEDIEFTKTFILYISDYTILLNPVGFMYSETLCYETYLKGIITIMSRQSNKKGYLMLDTTNNNHKNMHNCTQKNTEKYIRLSNHIDGYEPRNITIDEQIKIYTPLFYETLIKPLNFINVKDVIQSIIKNNKPLLLKNYSMEQCYGVINKCDNNLAQNIKLSSQYLLYRRTYSLCVIDCLNNNNINIQSYLDDGVDIDIVTNDKTALIVAIEKRFLTTIQQLINYGANVNNMDISPLHYACKLGNIEIIQLLLGNGADINLINNSGKSPIYYACKHGNIELIKYLIEHGANFNDISIINHLINAIDNNDIELLKYYIEHGANINEEDSNGYSLLMYSCMNNKYDMVKYLIDNGADVFDTDNYKYTTLHHSCKASVNIVQCLLDRVQQILDSNEDNMSVSQYVNIRAIDNEDIDSDSDEDNSEKTTALILAVSENNIEVVKLLLNNGADVSIRNEDKQNALHMALTQKNKEIFNILFDYINPHRKAEIINMQNWSGDTLLHMAHSNGYYDIVNKLIENGANPNIRNNDGIRAFPNALIGNPTKKRKTNK